MTRGYPRGYGQRLRDAYKVPLIWILAAVLSGGRLFFGTRSGGLGAAFLDAAVVLAVVLLLGVPALAAFSDPYGERSSRKG